MRFYILVIILVCISVNKGFTNDHHFQYDKSYIENIFEKLEILETSFLQNPNCSFDDLMNSPLFENEKIQPLQLSQYNKKDDSLYLVYGIIIGVGGCLLLVAIYWFILLYGAW